jgi:hypothetical protein
MSWSNAALPSAARIHDMIFQKGKVLSHSSKIDTIDWDKARTEEEIRHKRNDRLFLENKRTQMLLVLLLLRSVQGLYHIADEKIASGIKLWSYGTAADSAWSVLSTAKHQTYI